MERKQTKAYAVYKASNTVTPKLYFGYTYRFLRRVRDHKTDKGDNHFHRAIRKYGVDKFTFKIVAQFNTENEAKVEEVRLIELYDTFHNGYNCTLGGDGVQGLKQTKEQRQRHSEFMKGRKLSKEHRKKISEAGMGKKMSPEARKKMSKAAMGKKMSPEARKKMSISKQNLSKEARKNMSKATEKFSKDQVLEIRKMLLQGIPQQIIADKFNVSRKTINNIKNNKQYVDWKLPAMSKDELRDIEIEQKKNHLERMLRRKPTKEQRRRSSESQKGEKGYWYGKKASKETCKKRSEAIKKLSRLQVLQIKKLLLQGIFQRIIAEQFNVTKSTIGRIKNNESYADILPKFTHKSL